MAVARYWTGKHTKHRLIYHVVWIPKRRRRVLQRKIAKRLRELLYEGCRINGWWINKLNILSNHIHVLIQVKPADAIADVVQTLKGATSRMLRKEFPELEEFIWGDSFWADGYFAETIGKVDEAVMRKYIDEQT